MTPIPGLDQQQDRIRITLPSEVLAKLTDGKYVATLTLNGESVSLAVGDSAALELLGEILGELRALRESIEGAR